MNHAARVAGTEVATEVLDVTDDGRASELVRRLAPWALVNNAGYLNPGLIEDVSPADARRQFDTMVFAPMRLAQHALPGMRRRGGGRIVNISSALAAWACRSRAGTRPRSRRSQVGQGSLSIRVAGRLVPTSVRDRVTRAVAGLR